MSTACTRESGLSISGTTVIRTCSISVTSPITSKARPRSRITRNLDFLFFPCTDRCCTAIPSYYATTLLHPLPPSTTPVPPPLTGSSTCWPSLSNPHIELGELEWKWTAPARHAVPYLSPRSLNRIKVQPTQAGNGDNGAILVRQWHAPGGDGML